MFVLDPSTRFGYFAYPLALLGWLALTKNSSPERTVPPPQGQPLVSGGSNLTLSLIRNALFGQAR